jgi:hypothetical protein
MIADTWLVRDLTVGGALRAHAEGMRSPRRTIRWAAIVAAAAAVVAPLAVPVPASAAWVAASPPAAVSAVPGAAREDPPDVTGVPVRDATSKLAAWNKAVFFQYVPAPDIDLGVDPSDVLVARAEWLQGTPSAVSARPVVRLYLGRRVPDLAGLTEQRARDEATLFAFRVLATPSGAGPDWIVDVQTPAAGTIAEFVDGPRVIDVVLTAPVAPTPTVEPTPGPPHQPPPRISTVELVVLGGTGVAAALLLFFGGLALRRAMRRHGAADRSDPGSTEHIEVRAHAGETTGPVLVGAEVDRSVRFPGSAGPPSTRIEGADR